MSLVVCTMHIHVVVIYLCKGLNYYFCFSGRCYTVKKVIVKIFPARESLVSDIPAGDEKNDKLFLQCRVYTHIFIYVFLINFGMSLIHVLDVNIKYELRRAVFYMPILCLFQKACDPLLNSSNRQSINNRLRKLVFMGDASAT